MGWIPDNPVSTASEMEVVMTEAVRQKTYRRLGYSKLPPCSNRCIRYIGAYTQQGVPVNVCIYVYHCWSRYRFDSCMWTRYRQIFKKFGVMSRLRKKDELDRFWKVKVRVMTNAHAAYWQKHVTWWRYALLLSALWCLDAWLHSRNYLIDSGINDSCSRPI